MKSGYNSICAQQQTNIFIADTTIAVAISSGWENETFTAIINLSDKQWKLVVNAPFPQSISGIDDSFIQTSMGMALMSVQSSPSSSIRQTNTSMYYKTGGSILVPVANNNEIGMSWLLKAALQDEIDAIMFLASSYANHQYFKNAAESEIWFRKAIELENPEAESKLKDLFDGRSSQYPFFKTSKDYNFTFSLIE